jgi:hypothetical protein
MGVDEGSGGMDGGRGSDTRLVRYLDALWTRCRQDESSSDEDLTIWMRSPSCLLLSEEHLGHPGAALALGWHLVLAKDMVRTHA